MASNLDSQLRPLLDWLERHGNAHRLLWLLALASFLVAWNRGLELLYGLLALVLAVLLVSWLLPWLSIRKVQVLRRQIGQAQAGQEIELEYRLSSPRPAHYLLLQDTLPCCVEYAPQPVPVATLRGERVLRVRHRCDRRGVFKVDNIGLASGWPFGFVELNRTQATQPCRLVVSPRRFRIAALPMLRTNLASTDGYSLTDRPDINSEFAGVRDYRFGDSLKHIHWAASARQQHLVVREYESHDRPHLLVVVDARAQADKGRAPWSSFEFSLMIAASLIDYSTRQQIGLHLLVGCRKPVSITVPPGARNPDDFIEPLAWCLADGTLGYDALLGRALERFGDVHAVVTMRNQTAPAKLPTIGTGHLDILYQDQSFSSPEQSFSDGWQAGKNGSQRLLIGRNSNLAGMFNQFA